jgi:hypothetical protein
LVIIWDFLPLARFGFGGIFLAESDFSTLKKDEEAKY